MIASNVTVSQIVSTKTREHCLRRVGDISLLVSCQHEFGDDEWRELIDLLLEATKRYGTPTRAIIYTPKFGPSALQRALMRQQGCNITNDKTFRRLSFVTDSTLARGAITALGWAMKYAPSQVQAYSTARTSDAVAWACDGTRVEAESLFTALDELAVYAGYKPLR